MPVRAASPVLTSVIYLAVAATWMLLPGRWFPVPSSQLPLLRLAVLLLATAAFVAVAVWRARRPIAHAQSAAQDADTRYQHLRDAGSDAVFLYSLGPDTGPLPLADVSDVACQRLGMERELLRQRTILDLFTPDSRDELRAFHREPNGSRRAFFGLELQTATGACLPVAMTGWRFGRDGRADVLLVARDVSDSRRVERALLDARLQSQALLQTAPVAIIEVDDERRVTTWNATASALLGWTPPEVIGLVLPCLVDDAEFARTCEAALAGAAPAEARLSCRRKDGGYADVLASVAKRPRPDPDQAPGLLVILSDYSSRDEAETRLRRVQRTRQLLMDIKRVIARAMDESGLLQGVCTHLVEEGGYDLAWIGMPNGADDPVLRVVARAGHDDGYLDAARFPYAELRDGGNPSGVAMRTGQVMVDHNLLAGSDQARWRDEAVTRGFACVVALPLAAGLRPMAVLSVYMREAHAFDADELSLLVELADDLTYGLESVRARGEWERAEQALRDSAQQWQATFDAISDPLFVVDEHGVIVRCNRASAKLQETGPVVGVSACEVIHGTRTCPSECLLSRVPETRRPESEVMQLHGRWYHVSVDPLLDGLGAFQGAIHVMADITEQVRAEEDLKTNFTRLQGVLDHTIAAIAKILEIRDPYTAGHQQRVSRLASAIAQQMALPESQIEGLRVAGMLHDIGKLYVPAEILSKTGQLSDIELLLIRNHAQAGYDILKSIDFPWPVAQMAWQHHERIDGTGYPNALKGDDILIEARILAVSDVVESMASHRPYRPARGIDAALEEVTRGRGECYDPVVVDSCVRLFRDMDWKFE